MKKVLSIFAVIALVAVFALSFVACDDNKVESPAAKTIVFLGDSIAEALIGPSPVSERDNYGYYALVGRVNGLNYFNHSVSGHLTSGNLVDKENGAGLLEIVSAENESASLVRTHIIRADIIHISVLGNNALQFDLGAMLMEMADVNEGKTGEDRWFQACFDGAENESALKYAYDDDKDLFEYLHDGGEREDGEYPIRPAIALTEENTLIYGEKQGATDSVFNFPHTYEDIEAIVAKLRELNPTAKIVFQKVYNPVVEGTKLISPAYKEALAQRGYDTYHELRELAQDILDKLNGIIDEYNDNHPDGKVDVLDINKAFNDYAEEDVLDGKINLSPSGRARALLFADYTHPSNLGHAIIASETQKLLEEWGFASTDAVAKYKQIKCDQLDRMYAPIDGFDVAGAKDAVNSATTYEDVTEAYFARIAGYTPVNY